MDAPIDQPKPSFISLADSHEGKKFNSPNDVAFHSNGSFFFTDPPYGLPMQNENDPAKELPFQGVFKVSPDGKLTLLTDSLTRPNGIVFTPDEKTMIVANSDALKAIWYAYDVTENDSLTNARVFYDATAEAKTTHGLPDGLKIDKAGNIFATGPGGVWIFDRNGKVLGKIKTPVPAANCALADDDKTLFVTAKQSLLRVRMRK
jgi:gluconolactonase